MSRGGSDAMLILLKELSVYQALAMLTQLLRHGALSYQGGFCNLVTGQLVPLPIRAPTTCL